MKRSHTPGPWVAKGPRGGGIHRNYGIAHQSPGNDGGEFAEVSTLHSTPEAHAIQDANARLIAAAPDLLAALETLLNRWIEHVASGDCGDWDCNTEPPVIAAKAAIAKAK